jgi:hypothetical protein
LRKQRISCQGLVQARRTQAVISLLIEGNWLPVSNLIIGQVGKYRYSLYSPFQNATVSIVVDVMLVGRTKVVSLHSSVWLENATDVPVRMRLHVPPSLLTVAPEQRGPADHSLRTDSGRLSLSPAPSGGSFRAAAASPAPGAAAGPTQDSRRLSTPMHDARRSMVRPYSVPGDLALGDCDVMLRPLMPGEGQYLPLAAMMNGIVYFTAEGAAPSSPSPMPPCNITRVLQRCLRTTAALPHYAHPR